MRSKTVPSIVVLIFFAVSFSNTFAADWNPLPDTGQTNCYDTAGNVITCPEPGNTLHGQDGNYESVSPYYEPDNGVILDRNTNLMWQQNHTLTLDWLEAMDYCANLELGGYNDWGLPSRQELKSIIDYSRKDPASDPVFKSATDCNCSYNHIFHYWTSTVDAANSSQAWTVVFLYGKDSYRSKTSTFYTVTRCVRPKS